ncbi:hypothetical protein Sjap_020564 [Stephania japonica]|uniref:Uncharacterized protein n=1 Tax=Stephania japonica TaxID=461633 RepID=A0AAP0F3L6_9MAGN
MDEQGFNCMLDVFPVVRPRNYHVTSWQNAWSDEDKKEAEVHDIDYKDSFWEKLKSTAEGKLMHLPGSILSSFRVLAVSKHN